MQLSGPKFFNNIGEGCIRLAFLLFPFSFHLVRFGPSVLVLSVILLRQIQPKQYHVFLPAVPSIPFPPSPSPPLSSPSYLLSCP